MIVFYEILMGIHYLDLIYKRMNKIDYVKRY
ncbi:hypothetical protein MCEMIHM21_00305 [Candidatus Pelagibacterales bacterium]